MKKIKLKNIINIHLLILGIIFFSATPRAAGADITVSTTSSIYTSTGDDKRTWEGTLYAPTRIEVVRGYDETVDSLLPAQYFFKGRYTGNPKPNDNDKKVFRAWSSMDTSMGSKLFPAGNLTSDPDDSYHEIMLAKITNLNRVRMKLRALDKSSSSGLGVRGQWRLQVPLDVADGPYSFTTFLSIAGTPPVAVNCILVITTVSEITVSDIDFGAHLAGSTLDITERAEIIVRGGADRDYELTLEESQIELTNPNNSEKIPVELSIEGAGILSSRGTATDFLRATINTKAPDSAGIYQNTVTVYLNYN